MNTISFNFRTYFFPKNNGYRIWFCALTVLKRTTWVVPWNLLDIRLISNFIGKRLRHSILNRINNYLWVNKITDHSHENMCVYISDAKLTVICNAFTGFLNHHQENNTIRWNMICSDSFRMLLESPLTSHTCPSAWLMTSSVSFACVTHTIWDLYKRRNMCHRFVSYCRRRFQSNIERCVCCLDGRQNARK